MKLYVSWTMIVSDIFTCTLKMEVAGSSEKTLHDSQNTLRRISEGHAPRSLFCQLLGDLYRISLQYWFRDWLCKLACAPCSSLNNCSRVNTGLYTCLLCHVRSQGQFHFILLFLISGPSDGFLVHPQDPWYCRLFLLSLFMPDIKPFKPSVTNTRPDSCIMRPAATFLNWVYIV
jgi:hypothetical protein